MGFIFRILRLIIVFLLGYLLFKVVFKGEKFSLFKKKEQPHPQKAIEEMKKDPVCGTYIPVKQALKVKTHGETHYFCSEECKEKYSKSK